MALQSSAHNCIAHALLCLKRSKTLALFSSALKCEVNTAQQRIKSLLLSKSVNAQGLVLACVEANSVQHKIAFLANGSSSNNVKWVRNDFKTRPGAIDRLSLSV